jgi:hypothetical protein
VVIDSRGSVFDAGRPSNGNTIHKGYGFPMLWRLMDGRFYRLPFPRTLCTSIDNRTRSIGLVSIRRTAALGTREIIEIHNASFTGYRRVNTGSFFIKVFFQVCAELVELFAQPGIFDFMVCQVIDHFDQVLQVHRIHAEGVRFPLGKDRG